MRDILQRFRSATWTDARSLSIFRILFGTALLFTHTQNYTWLADVPATFFEPPLLSLANLFDRLPSRGVFEVLQGLDLVLTLLLTIGLGTRWASIGLLINTFVGNSFVFSLGKIDHPILLQCTLFAMVFQDWGRYFSVDAVIRKRRGKTHNGDGRTDLVLLAALVTFGFFTAGIGKALVWLDFDPTTSGFSSWLLTQYHTAGHTMLLASWAVSFPHMWVWELADIGAVVFELGFLWALFRRKRWLLWLFLWCGFHLVNTLTMNISFPANMIVVMAFVPWAQLFRSDLHGRFMRNLALAGTAVGMVISARPLWELLVRLGEATAHRPMELLLLSHCITWSSLALLFAWLYRTPMARGADPGPGTARNFAPAMAAPGQADRIILFDGVCNLCNGFVQFIINRDPEGRFHFAALQSDTARRLLADTAFPAERMDTIAYLREGKVLVRSDAALTILKDIGGAWSLCYAFMVFPRFLRDPVYRFVARNRYRWFGRKDSCMIPTPELRARFLDGLSPGAA